jgi:hypothetical protein
MWVFADADAAAEKARQATLPAEPYPEGRDALENRHEERSGA